MGGIGSGPKRKDGPRWPSGRLMYEWKDRCRCGHAKSKSSPQCRACAINTREKIPRPRCSCGGQKARYSLRCQACDAVRRKCEAVRRMVPTRVCQWCGAEFRRQGDARAAHDVLRFCSKKCWGAFRSAIAQAQHEKYRGARQIIRELTRAQRLYARSVCACGATITRPYGSLCTSCRAARRSEAFRIRREEGVHHLCPNCGQSFRGHTDDVYCSSPCAKQFRKKSRSRIRAIPLDERNRIAELLALVRAANRRIDEVNKSL